MPLWAWLALGGVAAWVLWPKQASTSAPQLPNNTGWSGDYGSDYTSGDQTTYMGSGGSSQPLGPANVYTGESTLSSAPGPVGPGIPVPLSPQP